MKASDPAPDGEGGSATVSSPGAAGGSAAPGPSVNERDGSSARQRPRVLVATRSRHKLAEIRDLLGDLPVDFLSLEEAGLEPREEEKGIEVHDTFDANAAAKARYFRQRSGLPTVADDSGLCVDALDGGPGVHTKRFAPAEMVARHGRAGANNRWLLQKLEGVPEEERGAHYHCSVAVESGGGSFVVQGKVHGRITTEPAGAGGFGYDPVFLLPEHGATFAELPPEVKQARSHRSRAFGKLRPWLERLARGAGTG